MTVKTPLPAIVYFGNVWSADHRTSSHHVALHLATVTRVLYVECPGLRPPSASGRDLRHALRLLRLAWSRGRALAPGLTVVTLLQLPYQRWRVMRWLGRTLALAQIRRWTRLHGLSEPITWAVVPHVEPVLARCAARLRVYYCIDDYASLPGVQADVIREFDQRLTTDSDQVFVSSEPLLEAKRRAAPSTLLAPHGVDFDHFAAARLVSEPVPADIADIRGPVVGCIALVERWIDLDLIGRLALELPDATIVVIGRVAVPRAALPRRANLRWMGARPYADLPAYGRRFDVGIIPYHLNRQVHHANPLKLREYLAMGLPVVSVPTPEIRHFAPLVTLAATPEEFAWRVREAIARGLDDGDVARRQAVAREMAWPARMEGVLAAVRHRLQVSSQQHRRAV